MHSKRFSVMFMVAGALVVLVSGLALSLTQPVAAQCGSQASSCKNCHEVQGLDPVNKDGTGWHESHAFGDFCYLCHGGNQQATDQTAAHAGMVAPLSDIKASCQQCHPSDLEARAQVYAKTLGAEIGTGSTAAATTAPASADATATPIAAAAVAQPAAPQPAGLLPDDPNLVDYVQRYNENALGQYPTNWGDVILVVLIAVMVLGGGALVVSHEGLVKVSFRDTRPVAGEYPADVVEMVPQLARLKPTARKSLRRLLQKPDATAEVLTSLEKLADSGEKKEQ